MDALTIAEAAASFRVGRATLFRLLAEGKLTRYSRPHDKRTYLDRAELEAVFTLTPRRKQLPA